MTRIHALTNTASGVAGEAAVAAALLRAGFRVARPYWNDDEVDLLVFWQRGGQPIPIPVQVKAVQSKVIRDRVQHTQKIDPVVAPQGLRKRYVEQQPALCLAIYSPARDKIWFFPGAASIREAHGDWLSQRSSRGRPSKTWDELADNDGVPIYVNVSRDGDSDFDHKWLMHRHSPTRLTQQISGLADSLFQTQQMRAVYAHLFPSEPLEEESDVIAESEDEEINDAESAEL